MDRESAARSAQIKYSLTWSERLMTHFFKPLRVIRALIPTVLNIDTRPIAVSE